MARLKRIFVAVLVALVGLAATGAVLAFVRREQVTEAWWRIIARRPLSVAQADALVDCEDPGWYGFLRILEQDLGDTCPPGWLESSMATQLGTRRTAWLVSVAADPRRSARARRRAGVTLLLAGEAPPAGLATLVGDPTTARVERDWLLRTVTDRGLDTTWMDPALRTELAVRAVAAGDWADVPLVRGALDDEAIAATPDRALQRARLADIALDVAGLGGDRLDEALDQHTRGMPVQLPERLARLVVRRGRACDDRSDVACLRFAADVLDAATREPIDGGPDRAPAALAEPPTGLLPAPLWEAAYDGDPRAVAAASRMFAAWAGWIVRVDHHERIGRLLGAVAHPRHAYGIDDARAGLVGDPVHALRERRASPWATALALVTLGRLVGVEVAVEAVGSGVVVRVAGRSVGIGPCGTRLEPPAAPGARWPERAILAQAAIEAAGGRLRAGDGIRAGRLALLAERLDPLGARGVAAAVARVTPAGAPEAEPGRAAGALLRPPAAPAPSGAESARAPLGVAWDAVPAEWNDAAAAATCPSPLGP